jgi:hypothetical protein
VAHASIFGNTTTAEGGPVLALFCKTGIDAADTMRCSMPASAVAAVRNEREGPGTHSCSGISSVRADFCPHELGEGLAFIFCHHVSTMCFHCNLTNFQFSPDLFVQSARSGIEYRKTAWSFAFRGKLLGYFCVVKACSDVVGGRIQTGDNLDRLG